MTSQAARNSLSPAGRVAFLAFILALVGATGIISFVADSRVEITLLALPVALGLLTRREFWRKAALVYAVLQAAVAVAYVTGLLRIVARLPTTIAATPYAPWYRALFYIAPAAFIIGFGFRVLLQPEVKALFRPFRTASGA